MEHFLCLPSSVLTSPKKQTKQNYKTTVFHFCDDKEKAKHKFFFQIKEDIEQALPSSVHKSINIKIKEN